MLYSHQKIEYPLCISCEKSAVNKNMCTNRRGSTGLKWAAMGENLHLVSHRGFQPHMAPTRLLSYRDYLEY